MDNRAGGWRKNLYGDAAYKSFMPAPLPPDPPVVLDSEMLSSLITANKSLALLDGMSTRIPNINMFISMYVRKEALMSSQIEGTQASLNDILDPFIEENANQNVADVVNYIKAIEFAVDRLKDLPLCNRLIRETHAVLMEGLRGHEKAPGEFRHTQNWIGGSDSTLKSARFIPPSPDDMIEAISTLELFMNNDKYSSDMDILIHVALIHYQFETIHPFLDGNGRLGRLLVVLFLLEKRVLSTPLLYISYSLKRNRTEYYDRLMLVRTKGDYEQWILFFLFAMRETADDAIRTIDKLNELHNKNMEALNSMGRSQVVAKRLFQYIESNPIIDIQKTVKAIDASFNSVSDSIKRFCDAGILRQTAGGRRNRLFSYEAYLEILRSGT